MGFENSSVAGVDFKPETNGPGPYRLPDFEDRGQVDRAWMVARGKTDETEVVLRVQK